MKHHLALLLVSFFVHPVLMTDYSFCKSKTSVRQLDIQCQEYCKGGSCLDRYCICRSDNANQTCSSLDFSPTQKLSIKETALPGTIIFTINVTGDETWEYELGREGSVVGSVWSFLSPYLRLVRNYSHYDMILKKTPDLEDIYQRKGIKLIVLTLVLTCKGPMMPNQDKKVLLEILPVNEFVPEFFPLPLEQTILENTKVGTQIYQVSEHTIDMDVNPTSNELSSYGLWPYLSYLMCDGRDFFSMESTVHGSIVLKSPLDFDVLQAQNSTQFILNISASDIHGMTSYTTLTIKVQDADDLPPEFYDPKCPLGMGKVRPCLVSYDASVPVNYKGQVTEIIPGPVKAQDMDSLDNPIEYSLELGPGELPENGHNVRIDKTTGQIFINSPYSKETQIHLVIVARERSAKGRSTQASLFIKVEDNSTSSLDVNLWHQQADNSETSLKTWISDPVFLSITIPLLLLSAVSITILIVLCVKLRYAGRSTFVEPLPLPPRDSPPIVHLSKVSSSSKNKPVNDSGSSLLNNTVVSNKLTKPEDVTPNKNQQNSSLLCQSSSSSFHIKDRNVRTDCIHNRSLSTTLMVPDRWRGQCRRPHTGHEWRRSEKPKYHKKATETLKSINSEPHKHFSIMEEGDIEIGNSHHHQLHSENMNTTKQKNKELCHCCCSPVETIPKPKNNWKNPNYEPNTPNRISQGRRLYSHYKDSYTDEDSSISHSSSDASLAFNTVYKQTSSLFSHSDVLTLLPLDRSTVNKRVLLNEKLIRHKIQHPYKQLPIMRDEVVYPDASNESLATEEQDTYLCVRDHNIAGSQKHSQMFLEEIPGQPLPCVTEENTSNDLSPRYRPKNNHLSRCRSSLQSIHLVDNQPRPYTSSGHIGKLRDMKEITKRSWTSSSSHRRKKTKRKKPPSERTYFHAYNRGDPFPRRPIMMFEDPDGKEMEISPQVLEQIPICKLHQFSALPQSRSKHDYPSMICKEDSQQSGYSSAGNSRYLCTNRMSMGRSHRQPCNMLLRHYQQQPSLQPWEPPQRENARGFSPVEPSLQAGIRHKKQDSTPKGESMTE